MTDPPKKKYRKQIKQCRDAVVCMEKAAGLLQKARIDDVPDDLREIAKEIHGLMDEIEADGNPPSAKIFQLRDYQSSSR